MFLFTGLWLTAFIVKTGVTQDLLNLALRKPTNQSTTWEKHNSSLAVNGDISGDNDFSHTYERTNQWWRVDLLSVYFVYKVIIHNRKDSQYNWRLGNISILISSNEYVEDPDLLSGGRSAPRRNFSGSWLEKVFFDSKDDNITLGFPAQETRHLAIHSLGRDGVTLREVFVYGCEEEIRHYMFDIEFSLDTGCLRLSWKWVRNLLSEKCTNLSYKYVYNCTNTKTFVIERLGEVNHLLCLNPAGHSVTCQTRVCLGIHCSSFTTKTVTAKCSELLQNVNNLAFNKQTKQSTTYSIHNSSLAVNGDISSPDDFSHTCEGDNCTGQWWRVDLQKVHYVYKVVLHNRKDNQYNKRLNNISILVSSDERVPDPVLISGNSTTKSRKFENSWTEMVFLGSTNESDITTIDFKAEETRHLAVHNLWRDGVTLREVLVYGCEESILGNCGGLMLQSQSYKNLRLKWIWYAGFPHKSCSHLTYTFKYHCEGQPQEIQNASANFSTDLYDYPPAKSITCYMSVCLGEDCTREFSNTTEVACREPYITYFNVSTLVHSITCWNATIEWMIDSGCARLELVSLRLNGSDTSALEHRSSSSLQISKLKPCMNYALILNATNNKGLWNWASALFHTAPLTGPEPPGVFHGKAYSSTCIQLSWSPPIGPNSCELLNYAVSCDGNPFKNTSKTAVNLCENLKPGSVVNCSVFAYNSFGAGSKAYKPLIPIPCEEVGTTSEFRLIPLNATCIDITWKTLNWTELCDPHVTIMCNQYRYIAPPDRTNIDACGFDPGRLVSCNWTAANKDNISRLITNSTELPCSNPVPAIIGNITQKIVDMAGSEMLEVSIHWNVLDHNCQGFNTTTVKLTKGGPEAWLTTNGTCYDFHCKYNISAYTNYTVVVELQNNMNMTSQSSKWFITLETAPGKPGNFGITADDNSSCINLSWMKPELMNGLFLRYEGYCSQAGYSQVINDSCAYNTCHSKSCGYHSSSNVNCSIHAVNRAGNGLSIKSSNYTRLKVDPHLTDVLINKETVSSQGKTVIPLLIKPAKLTNKEIKIQKYRISVERLTTSKYKRSTQQEKYIAAEINATESEFYLGDGIIYEGFLNKELEIGKSYQIELLVGYQKGLTEPGIFFSSPEGLNPLYIAVTRPPEATSLFDYTIPAAVVPSLVLIVALSVGLFCYITRLRNRMSSNKNSPVEMNNLKNVGPQYEEVVNAPKASSSKMHSQNHGAEGQETSPYENITEIKSEGGTIKKEDLEKFIEENQQIIHKQFQSFEKIAVSGETVAAGQVGNKGKNRYLKMYPADNWRVLLNHQQTKDNSDYINASFLKGFSQEKKYIAAQGPLAKTVDDFWLMIWQERPSAIVMTTKIFEAAKHKCEQYWPEKGKEITYFGGILVKTTVEENWADFVLRTFCITKDEETYVVKQFHFLSWPDHGVPHECSPFIRFGRLIDSFTKNSDRPLLVHCSAGVGRTGTFIAYDYLKNQVRETGILDPVTCVRQMRERRPFMIQTEDQYRFLYTVLLESLMTEPFITPAATVEKKMVKGKKIIQTEYQRLQKIVQTCKICNDIGKSTINRSKNRYQDKLPNDHYMPYVSTAGESGNYINAVLINGYRTKDSIICTQLPLQDTMSDFWQMVLYRNSTIIVQLDGSEQRFYPSVEGHVYKFQDVQIMTKAITDRQNLKVYDMIVNYNEISKAVKVLVNDSESLTPRSAVDTVVLIEELLAQTDMKVLTFTCLDGASKSGLLCCSVNVIQNLNSEQEVEVYHTVLSACLRQPHFIPSQEQYECLYDIASEYMSNFMDYSNFK